MSSFTKILFAYSPGNLYPSSLLLIARIAFGGAFMTHGLQKWNAFTTLSETFPDPIGVGSQASLALAIFAELICPIAIILGFLHRLALIPMIFTMLTAFFVIHGADPFATREPAFLYLIAFILLLLAGPGRISVDAMIGRAINKRNRTSYSSYNQSNFDFF